MAQWAKIKFYYDTMLGSPGSLLTATTTDDGDFSVDYIHNMLETNLWRAADTTDPHCLTYDAGEGNSGDADYLAILGHNLSSVGASIALQHSQDGLAYTDAFAPFAPASDEVILKEFTGAPSARYWRVKITGAASPVHIAVCVWGEKTELDYATASFDPHGQVSVGSTGVSYGGYVIGAHTRYTERRLTLRFNDADQELYDKVSSWWESSGLGNFFVAWNTAGYPGDVYLVRPDESFNNPFVGGGLYRDITVRLKGRKE